jgi:hypothetical protein
MHHLTQQWCRDNLPFFIDIDHWLSNSPDLNPLDYCIRDEFVKTIDWNRVTSRVTMIQQLNCSKKKFRQNVVFDSYTSWTNQLYHMSEIMETI